ncbi:MAG: hypothetical protein ACKN9W_14040 [Methylococcus sp.]
MLEWLGVEGTNLVSAFRKSIHDQPKPWGSPARRLGGLSDGIPGVQWSAGFDPDNRGRWLSVNLEGMKYDNWPIADLILNELDRPLLPGLVSQFGRDINGEIVWQRDYWQVRYRPPIVERYILPTPIMFRELTEALWREALEGARACLDPTRGYRGRAKQEVTPLFDNRKKTGQVSPHLSLQYLGPFNGWESFLTEGKARLEPFHEWSSQRCADRRIVGV